MYAAGLFVVRMECFGDVIGMSFLMVAKLLIGQGCCGLSRGHVRCVQLRVSDVFWAQLMWLGCFFLLRQCFMLFFVVLVFRQG